MSDQTAAWLAGTDAPRLLPPLMRGRLHEAIIANTLAAEPENFPWILRRSKRLPDDMQARLQAQLLTADADIANGLIGIDDPKRIPQPAAQRLQPSLQGNDSARRIYRILGVAAAALLVVAGAVFLAVRNDRSLTPINPNVALPTIVSSSVPPQSANPSHEPIVLGIKVTRPPTVPAGGSSRNSTTPQTQTLAIGEPAAAPQSSGSNSFGAFSRPSVASSGPVSSGGLLDSVTGLVGQLLQGLGLSQGSGSIHGLPVDDFSMLSLTQPATTSAPAVATAPKPAPHSSSSTSIARHNTVGKSATQTRVNAIEVPVHIAQPTAPSSPAPLISVSIAGISVSL
ncbi:MAG: hypothetical protein ACYDCC_06135 [Actinomycetota bacterium]